MTDKNGKNEEVFGFVFGKKIRVFRCDMSLKDSGHWQAIVLAAAADIFIIVGGPDSESDPAFTFDPQRVDAVIGDTVFFNCTFRVFPSSLP